MEDRINAAIDRADGVIGFDHYMQIALFEPDIGYYMNDDAIFGSAGDYVTAPEQGPLFAHCLAVQCAEVLERVGGVIAEYGPGSGRLAVDLLHELDRLGVSPERYLLIEPSPALRAVQQQRLNSESPDHAARAQWFDKHPDAPINGVVIANEVLDAMPVKRFVMQGRNAVELGVSRTAGVLGWQAITTAPAFGSRMRDRLHDLAAALPDGYASEINDRLGAWVGELRGVLQQGVALIIDYGYPRHEFWHPQRARGTLKCHYRHLTHDDPFIYPGLQDLTAAIDFTAVAEAADTHRLEVGGYTSQTNFLLACRLADALLDGTDDAGADIDLAQQAKRLLLPSEMGATCKVMALAAGWDMPLKGFARDERHRLAALIES